MSGATRIFEAELFGVAKPAGSKKGFPYLKAGGGGKMGVRMTHANPLTGDWMRYVASVARSQFQGPPVADKGIRIIFRFERVRPKSHFTSKGELRKGKSKWPITKPDLTKLVRAAEDALAGIVYKDDSQVVQEVNEKSYGLTERTFLIVEMLND